MYTAFAPSPSILVLFNYPTKIRPSDKRSCSMTVKFLYAIALMTVIGGWEEGKKDINFSFKDIKYCLPAPASALPEIFTVTCRLCERTVTSRVTGSKTSFSTIISDLQRKFHQITEIWNTFIRKITYQVTELFPQAFMKPIYNLSNNNLEILPAFFLKFPWTTGWLTKLMQTESSRAQEKGLELMRSPKYCHLSVFSYFSKIQNIKDNKLLQFDTNVSNCSNCC